MNRSPSGRVVRGTIVLPQAVTPRTARFVVVRIEDVSRADAPSTIVSEQRLENVRLEPGASLAYELSLPNTAVNQRARYSVSAHIDVTGSGEVEAGDLISTQSHPVLTLGNPDQATVPVRQI